MIEITRRRRKKKQIRAKFTIKNRIVDVITNFALPSSERAGLLTNLLYKHSKKPIRRAAHVKRDNNRLIYRK